MSRVPISMPPGCSRSEGISLLEGRSFPVLAFQFGFTAGSAWTRFITLLPTVPANVAGLYGGCEYDGRRNGRDRALAREDIPVRHALRAFEKERECLLLGLVPDKPDLVLLEVVDCCECCVGRRDCCAPKSRHSCVDH